GRAHVAENQMGGVGNAVRMGVDLALEYEDLALGQQLAQVVVGAAVAQTELEHRAGQGVDHRSREAETRALRLQAPDEAVETAHVTFALVKWAGDRFVQWRPPRMAAPARVPPRSDQSMIGLARRVNRRLSERRAHEQPVREMVHAIAARRFDPPVRLRRAIRRAGIRAAPGG